MFLLAMLVACGGEVTGDPVNGETLYTSTCSGCHGDDGTLGVGGAADLTFEITDLSDEEIADVILNGKGSMPAYGDLSDQDVADIIAYMHQAFE